jgi:hypothetical protein
MLGGLSLCEPVALVVLYSTLFLFDTRDGGAKFSISFHFLSLGALATNDVGQHLSNSADRS